jgi:hypothetical protein
MATKASLFVETRLLNFCFCLCFLFKSGRGDSLLWSNRPYRSAGPERHHLPLLAAYFFSLSFLLLSPLLHSFAHTHFSLHIHYPAMSIVSITQVNVLDNPTHFANPYQFEITFECIAPLTAGKQLALLFPP